MKSIIFIAPPAAGKGTQSQLVSQKYKIPHISAGQLLRDEIVQKSEIGLIVKDIIKDGNLVDDSIMAEVLIKRLNKEDCNNGFILDGYPRSKSQLEYLKTILDSTNKKINHVFLIEIDKELAKKRTIGRLICSNCGANYNTLFEDSSPQTKNKCDICAGTLLKREDDTEEVFEHRYETYINEASNIINYFENQNIIHKIDGSISKEYTFSKIVEVLGD